MPSRPARGIGASPLLAFVAVAIAVVGLGAWGFDQLDGTGSVGDDVYQSLQLLVLGGDFGTADDLPLALDVARFAAPVVGLGTVLAGLLLVFRDLWDALRIRLSGAKAVVIGLGEVGADRAEMILGGRTLTILVDRNPAAPGISRLRARGAAFVAGDATDPVALRRARAHAAHSVFVSCGDDAVNLRVLLALQSLRGRRHPARVEWLVHFEDLRLLPHLKGRAIAMHDTGLDVDFRNVFDEAARDLVSWHPPFDLATGRAPHPLVVGMDGVAESLLLQFVQLFLRSERRHGRLPVSVIGPGSSGVWPRSPPATPGSRPSSTCSRATRASMTPTSRAGR